jgi:SAM-dependent methyltransferase
MQNSYDHIAEQWHASLRGQTYVERVLGYVDLILAGLPSGAKVLDLGCGTGNPIARHIVQRGYRVMGVDQSKEMLRIAGRVIPESELLHSDMVEIEFADKFAAAVAGIPSSMWNVNIIQPSIVKSPTPLRSAGGCCYPSAGRTRRTLCPMNRAPKASPLKCSGTPFSTADTSLKWRAIYWRLKDLK